jgi:hypothetical protein
MTGGNLPLDSSTMILHADNNLNIVDGRGVHLVRTLLSSNAAG